MAFLTRALLSALCLWLASASPTSLASSLPTYFSSSATTSSPSYWPTTPTLRPSYRPTTTTSSPSYQPTTSSPPTGKPTATPTRQPTSVPTASPTYLPTISLLPSLSPTSSPSDSPTSLPTSAPTISTMPTSVPTPFPSPAPSAVPTLVPSYVPSSSPTAAPSTSMTPTHLPTHKPTVENPLKRNPIDCGNWHHDRSHFFTRDTEFGKIGQICTGRGSLKHGIDGRPYVCWNRYMFKTYVSSGFVTSCYCLLPLYIFLHWLFPKMRDAAEDVLDADGAGYGGGDILSSLQEPLWFLRAKQASYYAQSILLIIGWIYYMVLIASTKKCTSSGMWVATASAVISKPVAFPFVQCTFFMFDEGILYSGPKPFFEKYGKIAYISCLLQLIMACLSCSLLLYLIPLFIAYFWLATIYFFLLGLWGYINLKFMQCLRYPFVDEVLQHMPKPICPNFDDDEPRRDNEDRECNIVAYLIACIITIMSNVLNMFIFVFFSLFFAGYANPSAFKSFVLPCFFLLPLFAIYLGPLYSGSGYGDISGDFLAAFVSFPTIDLSFSLSWPSELPEFGQFCFATSLVIAGLSIILAAVARCTATASSGNQPTFIGVKNVRDHDGGL